MFVLSFIFGIVSILFSWIHKWGFIIAISSFVISIIAISKKKHKNKAMELSGFIYSIIAIIISLTSIMLYKPQEAIFIGSSSTAIQRQLLSTFDDKTVSGVMVKSYIQQYLNNEDVIIILVDSSTEEILAVSGEKQVSLGIIDKKTGYFEIDYDRYVLGSENTLKIRSEDINNPESIIYIDRFKEYNSHILRKAGDNTITGVLGLVVIV